MNRMAQGLVLLLLGCAVLHISAFSTIYLNYVRPGFRPFLIVTGAVVFVLGVIGLVREWCRPVPPPWGLGLLRGLQAAAQREKDRSR